MPNRMIREGILSSDRIELLDFPAEVFYRRLMSKVDDHGLFDARPSMLRTSLYPLRVDRVREADIARWIAICEKAGVIALYEHGGKPFGQMLDTRWQARSEPKHPPPPWGIGAQAPPIANTCAQVQAAAPVDVDVDVDVDEKKAARRRATPSRPVAVSEQVWSDWLQLRKSKRAPVTQTVLAGAVDEASKAGMTLEAFLAAWCRRGSQGLEAAWLKPEERGQVYESPRDRAARERMAQFAPGVAAKPPGFQQPAEVIDVAAFRVG